MAMSASGNDQSTHWIGNPIRMDRLNYFVAEELKTSVITLKELQSLKFHKTDQRIINSNRESHYWLKFDIISEKEEIVLFQTDPYLSVVEFYPSNSDWDERKKAGLAHPSSEREFPYPTPTFSHRLKKGINTFYFRLQSRSPEEFFIYINKPSDVHTRQSEDNFFTGICYGTIIVIALYSMFLLFILKDRTYGFYVFYAVASLFFLLSKDQFGNIYIWGDWTWFNFNSGPLAHIFLTTSFVAYGVILIREGKPNAWEKPLFMALGTYTITGSLAWFILSNRFILESLDQLFFIFLLYQGFMKHKQGHFHAVLFYLG
jgi:hypothetical protein